MLGLVLVSLLFVCALLPLGRAGRSLRHTTLTTAWKWSLAATALWGSAWISESLTTHRWRAELWYLAGVVALCPWMAVLGAKRPGVRVWSFFVLLPLVAVLTLPVLPAGAWGSSQATTASPPALQVPLPLALGYALVLLMGAGNYIGTRYALPAALAAVAQCLVIAPLSDTAPHWLTAGSPVREVATAAIGLAILLADRQSRRLTVAHSPLERLWCDYRDTFGIVWARRLLERVNDRAETERWVWRLTDDGFVPADSSTARAAPTAAIDFDPRIEQTFRWLLRRFVDPPWIDQRLGPDGPKGTQLDDLSRGAHTP